MVEIDKNWCLAAAEREDGQEVGAGFELGPVVELRLKITALEKEVERLTTEGEIANARNSELLAENQIMYRELDRISRSVAGSPHLVKLARGALERVSGRRNND